MITIDLIRITAFGGLKEREMTFRSGLNLLRGDNESGKSTTIAFLRWILYGYSSPSEKKHFRPLDGALPSGMAELTVDGERYRIVRRTSAQGRDTVQITHLPDGNPLSDDREPGMIFFGIPEQVFDQTALIRQGDGGVVDGKKLSDSMNNILSSADESVSVEKALNRLDQERVRLWYLNRKGGAIYELEGQLSDLRARERTARERSIERGEIEGALSEKKKLLAEHREKAETHRLSLLAYNHRRRLEKEELLAEKDRARIAAQSALRQARDGGLPSGYLPTDAFIDGIRERERALLRAEEEMRDAEHTLAALAVPGVMRRDPMEERLAAQGGAQVLIDRYRDSEQRAKRYTVLGVILLPVLIGILFLVLAGRERKKNRLLLAEFGCTTREEWQAKLASLSRAERARSEHLTACEQALAACRSRASELRRQADEAARMAGGDHKTVLGWLNDYEARLNALSSEWKQAKSAYESLRTLLQGEETPEIDPATLPDLPEDFDVTRASRSYQLYAGQLQPLQNQIHELQLRQAELIATAEDLAELSDLRSEGEKRLKEMKEEHEALALAMQALSEAAQSMRDNVTGTLAARAGELLGSMTHGRFTTLGVDADLSLHASHPDQDGMALAPTYLSEGTRNQAYLALRLALSEQLCEKNALPPLLLDEALVYLDDSRLSRVLSLLQTLDRQVLLFTATDREERVGGQR